ncbi:FtsX-like permease family protein [Kitasatospora sp. NPDC096147]|uniref:FtsX-like permease family protein n=1 Tax=Kitasatospora sp. NPDC096147 TaxID=3364093 RepID=UPI003824EC4E
MALTGVGRRLGQHGLVLVSAAVSILVATAVLAAVAGLAGAAATAGVRERLARDPGRVVEVDARWSASGMPAGEHAVRAALERTMGGTPYRTEGAVRAVSAVDLLLPPAGRLSATDATLAALPVALPDPGRYAQLRSGSWPTEGGGTGLPVAIPESAADRLGLDTGSTATVRDPVSGGPLRLTVTGVYRPDPAAAVIWSHLGGADREAPELLLADAARLTSLPGFADRTLAVWLAWPEVDGLELPGLLALRERIAAFAGSTTARSVYRGGTQALAETRVRSDFPAALDRQAVPALTARSEAAVPLALLAALAALVLMLTARRLADALAADRALRHARGAGAVRLLAVSAGEWASAAVPAGLGGLLLAGPLLGVVLRVTGGAGADGAGGAGGAGVAGLAGAAAEAARTAWWAAGFALLVHGTALLLPLAVQPAGPDRWVRRGGGGAGAGRRLGVQRAGVDLALLVPAVLAFLQLRHYQGLVAHRPGIGLGSATDPVLVVAPMVMAVAGAVLLLRLFPLAGRLLERTARRARGLVLPLGAWQLSREAGRQSVPVLATVLAVACGSLAAGVLGALPASDRDRAAFAVGADLRLTGVSGPAPLRQAELAALPGVTGLTPVAERQAYVGGTAVQTVAVDTAVAGAHGLPLLRSDQAAGPVATLLAPLTAPAGGLAVPGRPDGLEAVVQAGADRPLTGAQLLLWVQDAQGLTEQLAAPLTADGRPHVLALPLADGARRAHPLTVSRLGVRFPADLGGRATLDLRVSRISAVGPVGPVGPAGGAGAGGVGGGATVGESTVGESVAGESVALGARTELALPEDRRWYRSGTDFADPTAVGCPATGDGSPYTPARAADDRAAVCSWRGGGAELLGAVLRSQTPAVLPGPDPGAREAAFVVLPAQGGGAAGPGLAVPSVLPAVADRALLDAVGAEVGDTLPLTWERGSAVVQQVRITGELDALPGDVPGRSHLLMDLPALAAARAAAGLAPPADSRWWLRSADPEATRAALDGRGTFGRAESVLQVAGALHEDAFRTGLRSAWVLVLLTAPLFAVTALTLHTVGTARARRREFAVLRALGVRRGELVALLRAEQVAVTALPVLLGGLLGLGLTGLLPWMVLDDGAGPLYPAVLTGPGWPALGLTALGSGLLLTLAVLVLTRLLARVDLVRVLRAGEHG